MGIDKISYKFRIYPKEYQIIKMNSMMYEEKRVYNQLLELKRDFYLFSGMRYIFIINDNKEVIKKSLSEFDLINYLSGRCKSGRLYSQSYGALAGIITKSYDNFFRRVKDKSCKDKGFPKFKSYVDFIIYPQSGFKIINDKSICISKIGKIPIVIHRNILGEVKTLTIKKNKSGGWYVCLSCDVSKVKMNNAVDENNIQKGIIGIDNGLGKNFIVLSNGDKISYPRYLIDAKKRLLTLQRKLSRQRIRSNNWKKTKLLLAKAHQTVLDKRDNFLHQITNQLTNKYKIICCEDTQIKELVEQNSKKNKSKLNKKHSAKNINILDCSWGKLFQMLIYKQQMKGGLLLKNPRTRGSSKRCCDCSMEQDMPLNKREYICPNCGLILDRDVNGARNHLKDCIEAYSLKIKEYINNTDGQSEINACRNDVRPLVKAVVDEAGTIFEKVQVIEPIIGSP